MNRRSVATSRRRANRNRTVNGVGISTFSQPCGEVSRRNIPTLRSIARLTASTSGPIGVPNSA